MSATPLHGQVVVTTVAQPLSVTAVFVKSWTLYAPLTNGNSGVFVGSSGVTIANGHQFDPGNDMDYEVRFYQGESFYPLQPSDIWVVAAANVGDKVTWFASP